MLKPVLIFRRIVEQFFVILKNREKLNLKSIKYFLVTLKDELGINQNFVEGWLSYEVRSLIKAKRKVCFKEKICEFSIASSKIIWLITLWFLIFLFISIMLYKQPIHLLDLKNNMLNIYLSTWQIQAGISAILLPILLFVIQVAKDDKRVAIKSHEILIRETFIFPFILFSLAGTLRIGIDILFFVSEIILLIDIIFVVIMTIILAVYAYYNALKLLFSPSIMKEKGMVVAREKMSYSLDESIEIRLANSLLFEEIEKLNIGFWPFAPDHYEEQQYLILKSSDMVVIDDIHLGKLREFIRKLPWKTDNAPTNVMGSEFVPKDTETTSETQLQTSIWLMKRYGERFDRKNNGLIRLEKHAFETLDAIVLESQLKDIFKMTPGRKKVKGRNLRVELSYLKDNIIEAIVNGKKALMQDGLDMYEQLIVSFIEKLKHWESLYDKKRALQELSDIEGSWSEIEWINIDLREIIDSAINTENKHIIHSVLHFSKRLATLAFFEKDYYIFHIYTNWIPYFYSISLSPNSKIMNDIVDKCWRYLKEMADYTIMPEMERSTTESEVNRNAEFADGIVLIFNQLLKRAYREKQIDHFKTFLQKLRILFSDYGDKSRRNVDKIKLRLEMEELTQETKGMLTKELTFSEHVIQVADKLEVRKNLVLYGINAWILHEYDNEKLTEEHFKDWHKAIPSFGDLSYNWRIFLDAIEHDRQHIFGWDWWESEEHPEEQSYIGRFHEYLQLLCCIRCLVIIKGLTSEQREQLAITPSKDILNLADGKNSQIYRALESIENQPQKWRPVISNDGLEAIADFRNILENVVKAQKEIDVKIIIAAKLCEDKIEKAKQDIIEGWKNNADLRNIIKKYGIYEYIDNEPPKTEEFFLINRLDLKEMYIEESELSTEGWAKRFGENLARGENKEILKNIVNNLPFLSEETIDNAQSVIKSTNEALSILKSCGYEANILITNSFFAYRAFAQNIQFKKEYQSGVRPKPSGYLNGKPIYYFAYKGDPIIIIVDLKRMGTWFQYKPRKIYPEEIYLSNKLSFYIKPVTDKFALELIEQQPERLIDKHGEEKPREEVLLELQQRVHIKIAEQFEFKIEDKHTGYKIPVARRY